ncbi:peptidase M23-like protein [Gelidibacter algens]|uniref:Peptidase M23-like protein n=1 Tax=Gelidibacter algens TaxID=49280 RepID=A0A1A7R386_9FLAO|nr:peptidoglycan DD-metalloendopeptidase family protein [Gelidibacter algens]OBX25944.1 peptidase M23 [Gelidibacter algens]RAJ25253.1 peptidase M23-like protein [Gelidibacter algens]
MTSKDFTSFLKSISTIPLSVLDANIPKNNYTPLELSISNKDLQHVDVGSSSALEVYITNHMHNHNALVAFGGYNETRNIYQRSVYFNQTNLDTERNIHIGMDLWIAANSPIFSPLNATVHSFKNNTNHGDYGPTIILKHHINTVEFYTLYGHLSVASIADLKVGQVFNEGQQIATLGEATVNGDYPPHLHFQIIKDMQGLEGDYPGVCNKKDLEFYLENCPDPNLLLGL